MKTIDYRHGSYKLTLTYKGNNCQATMEDISAKYPLIWSIPTTKEVANGMIAFFENIGYFEPIDTTGTLYNTLLISED